MENEKVDKSARRQIPDVFSELLKALQDGYAALKTDEGMFQSYYRGGEF